MGGQTNPVIIQIFHNITLFQFQSEHQKNCKQVKSNNGLIFRHCPVSTLKSLTNPTSTLVWCRNSSSISEVSFTHGSASFCCQIFVFDLCSLSFFRLPFSQPFALLLLPLYDHRGARRMCAEVRCGGALLHLKGISYCFHNLQLLPCSRDFTVPKFNEIWPMQGQSLHYISKWQGTTFKDGITLKIGIFYQSKTTPNEIYGKNITS